MNGFHDVPATLHAPRELRRLDAYTLEDSLRSALVDEIECGLIVCDGQGRLRFANRTAQHELASGRALRRCGDGLCCTSGMASRFEAAMRAAAVKGRRQLVTLGHGSERLMVSVLPLRLAESDETFVLVVLGRRRPCSELGLEMLASVYGLTLAERRVMGALMSDTSPREIATAHAVALSTVRTQISSIRHKLGARSIDGLMIRAAEVPPVTSALRLAGSGPCTAAIRQAGDGYRAAA